MGEAAPKLPEGQGSRRSMDGITSTSKPKLTLLSEDQANKVPTSGQYVPPSLSLVQNDEDELEDEETDEEENSPDLQLLDENDNGPEIGQGQLDQNTSAAPSNLTPPRLEGEPEADYRQRVMNTGVIPSDVAKSNLENEQVPGGQAYKPPGGTKSDEEKDQAKDKLKQQATTEAKSAVKKGAKATTDAAGQAIKKAAAQAAKWAAELATKAVAATAEYWLPILFIIIAVILMIVAIVFLIRALQTPNANGSSPVQAADIVNDHPLIQSVLALSSPAEFQKYLDENKAKLLANIDSFIAEINARHPGDGRIAPTTQSLTEAKTLISAYTTPDATKASAIHQKILDAVKPWSVTLNPGGLIFPISGFNVQHPGTGSDYYTHNPKRQTHRGIDRGTEVGTLERAPADSEIIYLNETECKDYVDMGSGCNGGFGNAIVGKITTGNWAGYYWEIHHLKQFSSKPYGITKGSIVKQGQLVGQCGYNGQAQGEHIHFQVDKPEAASGGFPVGIGREEQTIDPYTPLGWQR